MVEDSPVVKLVNAVLLAALHKGATTVRIRPDTATEGVVEMQIAGVTHEEMRPPGQLAGSMIRRLGVMASVPTYPKGAAGTGFIHLTIGERRAAYFALRLEGHGPAQTAELRVLDEAAYRAATTT